MEWMGKVPGTHGGGIGQSKRQSDGVDEDGAGGSRARRDEDKGEGL